MIELNIKDKKIELVNEQFRLNGEYSGNFLTHIYNDLYVFDNEDQEIGDFYEAIKTLSIKDIPNNVHFVILNISSSKISNPLHRLPFPFTLMEFLKRNNEFFVIYESFVDDEEWKKKWEARYYFHKIEEQVKHFDGVSAIEYDEKFSSYEEKGKIMIKVLDNVETIKQAFEKSLEILNILISRAENSMLGLDGFIKLINIWKENIENNDESFWQSTLKKYSWVIAQCFSMPLMLFQDQAYVGDTSIDNRNGSIADYAYKNDLTGSLVLVEIKNPKANIIGRKYRNTYTISSELTGSINQLLNYKNNLQKEFYKVQAQTSNQLKTLNSKCLLIIGRLDVLDNNQKESFELFRNELKSVDIVTFDELFLKVETMINIIKENQDF
ncbi:Shedu immune nuclease family protein [Clostridium sp. WILCCON 0269]|uniref:Shedu immune nuclease family protein n=1 Tax=Candidatus Clostridium eludens TaxID=3381663 RepID=A0ABW8SRQ7_9CLOT